MYPFRIPINIFGQNLAIGPYELFLGLAMLVAILGGLCFAVKRGFAAGKVLLVLVAMCLAAMAGARLLNALANFSAYLAEPGRLWQAGAEGFSLYGGILAALAAGYFAACRQKLNAFRLADTLVPFLGISIAIMRIGCFLNGCCFGRETDLPWGIVYPFLSPAHLYQLAHGGNFFTVNPVHPTQLYELAAALLLSALAFHLLRKKLPAGTVLLIFMAGFSLFRFFNYFLRVNPDSFSLPEYFYPALYLGLFVAGLGLLLWRWHGQSKTVPALAR